MSTINASTDSNPANPIDYATTMGNIAANLNAATMASVSGVLAGLPSSTSMAAGAYGFEQGVINQTQQNLNTSQNQVINYMNQAGSVILPTVQQVASLAAANQAAAIQASSQLAASAGGGGKK